MPCGPLPGMKNLKKKRKKAKKRKNMLADILTFIGSSIYLCPKKRGDEI